MSDMFSYIKRTCTILPLAAVLLFSGCDSIPSGKTAETSDITVTAVGEAVLSVGGEGGESLPEGYPVIINDTEIRTPPEKVICLSGGLTEMIYELGFGDKLIGRGSYCEYPEQVISLTDFGKPTAPEIDRIKNAAPDVVITATRMQSRDIVALSESGINVVYIPSPRSVDEFGRIYSALGMMFVGMFDGEETGSKAFFGIKNQLSGTGIDIGKFVYITEGLRAAGGDTFEGSVLSLFGTNAAESASGYSFDIMQLSDDPPDILIINNEITEELRASDSVGWLYSSVGKVVSVDNSFFESPSARLTGLCEILSGTGGGSE